MLRGLPEKVEKAEYVIGKLLGLQKQINTSCISQKQQSLKLMNKKSINLYIPSELYKKINILDVNALQEKFKVKVELYKKTNQQIRKITIKGQIGSIRACKVCFDD